MTEALLQRLGTGARFDDPAAPQSDLLKARRATAAFARVLNGLANDDLTPARRVIIATIGYEARALAYALEGLAMARSERFDLEAHISKGVTLPAHALRFLVQHSSIHLNVTWRDLSAANWDVSIVLAGRTLPVLSTPGLRAEALKTALNALSSNDGNTLRRPSSQA